MRLGVLVLTLIKVDAVGDSRGAVISQQTVEPRILGTIPSNPDGIYDSANTPQEKP